MRNSIGYGVAALGVLGSLVGLFFGLRGEGPGPKWLWIIVAYACIAFAGFMSWLTQRKAWREEHRKAAVAGALPALGDALIRDWAIEGQKFVNIYHKPIELPMSFDMQNYDKTAYRIGRLQSASAVIFDAAVKMNKKLEPLDNALTVEDLIRRLERCVDVIRPLSLS